jgi:hypothetical protein
MKTNNYRKAGAATFFAMIVPVVAGFMAGCQKGENLVDRQEEENGSLPFLSINRFDFDYNDLSESEMDVINQAFRRITFSLEDGYYQIEQQSGSQVNISEELFSFFQTAVDNSNDRNAFAIATYIPRLKSGSESGANATDCVARTIVGIAASLGSSLSYNTVNSWITSQYGNGGVP